MRGLLRYVGLAVCVSFALAAPAHAGSFGDSATPCEGRKVEQPFKRWLDPFATSSRRTATSSAERPSGSWPAAQGRLRQRDLLRRRRQRLAVRFTSRRELGDHAADVRSAPPSDSPLLRQEPRRRRSSPPCSSRPDREPAHRRRARSPSASTPAARSWHPSLPGLVLADFLSVLGDDGELAVAFRFKPIGSARSGRSTTSTSIRSGTADEADPSSPPGPRGCRRARGSAAPPRARRAPRPPPRARPAGDRRERRETRSGPSTSSATLSWPPNAPPPGRAGRARGPSAPGRREPAPRGRSTFTRPPPAAPAASCASSSESRSARGGSYRPASILATSASSSSRSSICAEAASIIST